MPDAIFAHPRLAPVYDVFDGDRDDLAAYLDIANELGAGHVLDVGCGTGCLAVLLADNGRRVVGVDPAEASLEVARSKDPTGRITWVHGDATMLPTLDADLAVMTGNVADVFVTDEEWAQTLRGIHAALRPADIWCSRPDVPHIGLGTNGPLTLFRSPWMFQGSGRWSGIVRSPT